jgi:aurora kinase
MKTSEETPYTEKRSWVFEDFDFYDALGNGKFGYVYKAKEKKSGKIVAVKLINQNILTQYNFFSQLKNEIEIHSRLM